MSFLSSVALVPVSVFCLLFFGLLIVGCKSSEPNTSSKISAEGARQISEVAKPAEEIQASNRIKGRPFKLESAILRNGVLHLKQGKDFFPDLAVLIFLFLDTKEKVPEGRTFEVPDKSRDASGSLTPHIHVKWREKGKSLPDTKMFMRESDYSLKLSFGKEKELGKLPGVISLTVPGETDTQISGEFVAQIEDFRFIEGKPTLDVDSFETLSYVAQEYLKKKLASDIIEITDTSGSKMATSKRTEKPWAQCYFTYHTGDGKERKSKLNFLKSPKGWEVQKELTAYQIFQAHPVYPLEPNVPSRKKLWLAGARHFEEDVLAKLGDRELKDRVQFTSMVASNFGVAKLTAKYVLQGASEKRQKSYLFQLNKGDWQVVREISEEEDLDKDTGKIVKR